MKHLFGLKFDEDSTITKEVSSSYFRVFHKENRENPKISKILDRILQKLLTLFLVEKCICAVKIFFSIIFFFYLQRV